MVSDGVSASHDRRHKVLPFRPTRLGLLGRNSLRQDGELVHQPNILFRCSPTSWENVHRRRWIFNRYYYYKFLQECLMSEFTEKIDVFSVLKLLSTAKLELRF